MADNTKIIAAAVLGVAAIVAFLREAKSRIGVPDTFIPPVPRRKPYFTFFGPVQDTDKFPPLPVRKPDRASALDRLYQKYATRYNLDWKLLKAIAIVESNERPTAKNPSDPSYGLMQVLCVTDGGAQLQKCKNKFNIDGWNKASPEALLNPDFNVMIASQILAWNIRTYGTTKGIAVYNSWGSRKDPQQGPFRNQGYVDKVLREYRALGGQAGSAISL